MNRNILPTVRFTLYKVSGSLDKGHRSWSGQTDRQTDGQTDRQGETYIPQYIYMCGSNNLPTFMCIQQTMSE